MSAVHMIFMFLVRICDRPIFEFRLKSGKELPTDIFHLFRFVTLHFPLVENIHPSFCTLRGVLVLVFASQGGMLLQWQRKKSFICSVKVVRNRKIGYISTTLMLQFVDMMLCAD